MEAAQMPDTTITTVTLRKGDARITKWCATWTRKAKAAGVRGQLRTAVVGRPSVGREAHRLTLQIAGQHPLAFSFKGKLAEAITDDDLRQAALSLMASAKVPVFDF